MEPDFWHEAWERDQIHFHEGRPNRFLVEHVAHLGPPGRVLVPLAGKSHDMLLLAEHGHEVIGVELSRRAVEAFFEDNELTPERSRHEPYEVWSAGAIRLLVGDFFALRAEHLGDAPLTGLYDRAALVALPEEMRVRYAGLVRRLMPAGARGLIVSFEYRQGAMSGPPFSVTPDELASLFAGLEIEELERSEAANGRLEAVGEVATARCHAVKF
jgi:thiopurine S-methyltransferase